MPARCLQILDGLEQRHDIDRAAAGRIDEAGLLQQQRDLQHVGHPLAHRDDALGDRIGAEFGVGFGGRVEHREFADRFLAVLHEGRRQRPGIAQLARQKRDPRLLVQRQIGHAGHRRIDQLRDRAFMHRRILPDIEARQMKAEAIHGPAQMAQPAARDHARIVRDQRAIENIEIGLELADIGVRRGLADRRPRGFDIEPRGGGSEPGVDAGHRQPVGLAASMRRGVGRALGERAQILRDIRKMRRERQFGAEHMQFLEIKAQHAARLHLQRAAHHFRRHERVAVAIAADPASHPQERRQFALRGAVALVQPVFQRAMQPRHFVQEGVVIKRQAVGDLVEHGELGAAQQVGLPQRQHRAAQLLVARRKFFRRQLDPFAPVQQCRDLHLAVDGALAANLGRMRGQHRADQGRCEELAQVGRAEAGAARMRQGQRQRSRERRSPGLGARPHLPDVVLIFGDVGKVREIAEGAHDAHGLAGRHAVEDEFELAPRRLVVVAVKPDRGLPDALDQIEDIGAFLVAHGVAEDASKQPDVVPQPRVFFKRRGFLGAAGLKLGVGRHDLG